MKKWTNEKYTSIAVYALLVILAALAFLLAILHLGDILGFLEGLLFSATSIVIGVLLSLALFPVCHSLEGLLQRRLPERFRTRSRTIRLLSVILAFVLLLLLISLIVVAMIPMGSLDYALLQDTLVGYLNNVVEFIENDDFLFGLIEAQTGLLGPTYEDSPFSDEVIYAPPPAEPVNGVLTIPVVTIQEDGTALWQPIPYASGYTYRINGGEEQTSVLCRVALQAGDTITVKAISTSPDYTESAYSVPRTYTLPTEDGEADDVTAQETPENVLGTPHITIGEDGIAVWEAIPYASAYRYRINGGEELLTTETALALQPGDSLTVQAIRGGVTPSELLSNFFDKYSGLIGQFASGLGNALTQIISSVSDILMGVIIAFYFLLSRDMIQGLFRKLAVAVIPAGFLKWSAAFGTRLYTNFISFISARLTCSFALGVLCYLAGWIFQIQFFPLLSLLVLVLNIVPVIGPLLGGALGTLIVLIVQPQLALVFLAVIIGMNLVEQYVIEHYLLRRELRPNAALVIVIEIIAYMIGGLWGMIFAIPIFATLRTEFWALVNHRLRRKGLPTDMESYTAPQEEAPPPAAAEDTDAPTGP